MKNEGLKQNIEDLIHGLENRLPDIGLEYINDYMRVGEYILALELLSNIIYEHDISICKNDYIYFVSLCERLKIKEIYWKTLERNIEDYGISRPADAGPGRHRPS